MEIEKISHKQWKLEQEHITTNLFDQNSFLETIAAVYNKEIAWYKVLDKGQLFFAIPLYYSRRKAELITHFFYQAIIKPQEFSEQKLVEGWGKLLEVLKEQYDAIDFKFAPYVEDIRPLIWAGFEHITRYTSVIDLIKFPNYSENIERSIKKALKNNCKVDVHTYHSDIVQEQIADMLTYGLGNKHAKRFDTWFSQLSQKKSTRVFELKNEENKRIGSSLYLLDSKKAYLIATMGGEEQLGGQAYLYDQAFRHFKELGILEVDLLGANIPSVALYKAKLGAELKSYYMVSYRKYKIKVKILNGLKRMARSMWR